MTIQGQDNTITCTRRIEFDAAHRIPGHSGKCKALHGHRYALEASFYSDSGKLNQGGMIIDFSLIQKSIKSWLDSNWDHNVILSQSDIELGRAIESYTGQKPFYLDDAPTAENMAYFLLNSVCITLFKDIGVQCFKVRLYETPNCYAECINGTK